MLEEGDQERAIAIVVAEGILSIEEARLVGGEAARAGQSLLERLHADGTISGPTFASLCAQMLRQTDEPRGHAAELDDTQAARQDPEHTWEYATALGSCPPRRPTSTDDFPVPGWDRYEPIHLLGQGGMGRVFLARDLRLDREVAIKFVRRDDAELTRRVVAEARAQARVDDPRVCKVYEVGEVRGRVYIAMQHIDGQPLSALFDELTFEQKAIVMRGAALGVAEAHRVGLIHRDLKPSNIMVERGADGELRPFVMDFGLARDWTDPATMTGTVLGTPHYMAPEQARGEVKQLDRRADVYSLGATLYALLVGRSPIEGANQLEVLARVVTDEPKRPRSIDPNVPADLEAIALKCLEKDRAKRYDSARALADDLGRFLGGEPVSARSASGLVYRIRKRLHRHRRAVTSAMLAATVLALALGYAGYERQRAAQQTELARRFTARVERIESMARYSALAPAHDLRSDRERLRGEMAALGGEIAAAGDLAAGPGHYARGRGFLALDDDDHAATELAAAWQLGHEPRVAYALALVQGRLYHRALRELERSELDKVQRAQRRRELEQQHREPALRYLRASRGAEVLSTAYVDALIAFYEARFDDALARLDEVERSGEARTWSYEVPLLRGEILSAQAEARPELNASAADLEGGRHALATAATIGRSVPAVYQARAELELTALSKQLYGSGDVEAPFAQGIAAIDGVLALLPDDASALTLRAQLQRMLAQYRTGRGEDVAELLRRAISDGKRAVAIAPERPEGVVSLANTYRQWGETKQMKQEDPSDQLGQALETLGAVAVAQRDAEFYVTLCITHEVWANYQDRAGQESAAHRDQAVEACRRAIRIDDRSSRAWLNLGQNYARRAVRPDADVDGDVARSRDALAHARELDPTEVLTSLYLGDLYTRVAKRKQTRGDDPAADRARAIESYQQGASLSPRNSYFPLALSNEYLDQARLDRDHGRDPLPDLALALAQAQRAVALAPEDGYGYLNTGCALLDRADYQQHVGVDPVAAAREAEIAFTQAVVHLPDHPSIRRNLADLHILLAGVEVDRGRDPRDHLRLAAEAIEKAEALAPNRPSSPDRRDKIRALLARWQARGSGGAARSSR